MTSLTLGILTLVFSGLMLMLIFAVPIAIIIAIILLVNKTRKQDREIVAMKAKLKRERQTMQKERPFTQADFEKWKAGQKTKEEENI